MIRTDCKNIQKVFKSYIETEERSDKYKREYKIKQNTKSNKIQNQTKYTNLISNSLMYFRMILHHQKD